MLTIAETEHEKAGKMLRDMLTYLEAHPERHTDFMDRWFRLCILYNTCVYPAKPAGAAVWRRLEYGTPTRIVECLESAAAVGRPDIWFVRAIA